MSDEDARDDATATTAKQSAPTVPATTATTTATAAEDDDARLRALVRRARSAARDEGLPEPGANDAARGGPDADAGSPPGEELAPDDDGLELDDVDLKDALRGALAPPPGSVAPRLLGGVQRRIRLRSRGRFFGDGWSMEESPRTTYIVTSALMLLLLGVLALALLPSSGARLP